MIRLETERDSTRSTLPHQARHATARQQQWHRKAANKLQQRPPDHCLNGIAFPEGDKLLIGHGWHKCRPKGDMKCLPCLCARQMDELYRSSTVFRKPPARSAEHNPENRFTPMEQVILGTLTRQGSRSAPTLPCQKLKFFGQSKTWAGLLDLYLPSP